MEFPSVSAATSEKPTLREGNKKGDVLPFAFRGPPLASDFLQALRRSRVKDAAVQSLYD